MIEYSHAQTALIAATLSALQIRSKNLSEPETVMCVLSIILQLSSKEKAQQFLDQLQLGLTVFHAQYEAELLMQKLGIKK